MSQYIFTSRIYLDSDPTVANASDIGLYDDADNGANQVLRWSEADISSFSPTYTWKTGIVKPSPFGDTDESADFSDGGDLPRVAGSSLRFTNIITYGGVSTQFDKILEDNSIRLKGLRCDIIRFEISGGSLVEADGEVHFRGICGDSTHTEKEYNIPLENSLFKRRANLSTIITKEDYANASDDIVGKTVPVTFGEFVPVFDANENVVKNGYAKFVRTAKSEIIYENSPASFFNTSTGLFAVITAAGQGWGLKVFPIVGNDGNTPPIMYKIKLLNNEDGIIWRLDGVLKTTGSYAITNLVDYYVYVIDGNGQGGYRKIESALVDLDSDATVIEVVLADYFEEILGGNATATADDQSWIQFIDITRQYTSDVWECKDFLDTDGNAVTNGLDIYSYVKDANVKVSGAAQTVPVTEKPFQFYLLPQYGYTASGTNNTTLDIDVKLFEDNPDQMQTFLIKPIENFGFETADTFSNWRKDSEDNYERYERRIDGYYPRPDVAPTEILPVEWEVLGGTVDEITSKDENSIWGYYLCVKNIVEDGAGFNTRYITGWTFTMPTVPNNFNFDSVNLFLKVESNIAESGGWDDSSVNIRYRRFIGFAKEILSAENGAKYKDQSLISGELQCMPDFWYNTSPDTKNKYFYTNNTLTDPDNKFWGYQKFEFSDVDSVEKYQAIKEACIFFWHKFKHGIFSVLTAYHFYKMVVGFKKKVSIKDAVYLPYHGRIYGDTWGARKTAANMINNPIDILEHTLRLQNWSEQGETKNWGKEYADVPLIDVSTSEGGFDYEDLNTMKAIKSARQILNYSDAWSDNIARSLCKGFFLCNFQDPITGEEKIAYIAEKSKTTPTTTITLSDIIGPISPVIYPKAKGIYTEPAVRYAKNNATGGYDKIIQITNAGAATYDASYVIGLSGDTAELMWTRAHVLYQVTRQIEPPPSDMVDHDWITEDDDAILYLDTWLSYMGAINTDGSTSGITFQPKKRISFTVSYDTGKAWFLTKHCKLQLPHQTDDNAIEFVIEKINKSIKMGKEKVTVQVMLYGSASEIALYVQDVYTSGTLLDDWQDIYTTQAEEAAQGKDVQDIT